MGGDVAAGPGPRRWADLPTPALGAVPAGDDRHVALVPVGATEQHGPHLPVGTDTIVARSLAERVSGVTGSLVLPEVALGVGEWHGTALAGTLAATPEAFLATVDTVCTWAVSSGVRRLPFLNGHVGNTARSRWRWTGCATGARSCAWAPSTGGGSRPMSRPWSRPTPPTGTPTGPRPR